MTDALQSCFNAVVVPLEKPMCMLHRNCNMVCVSCIAYVMLVRASRALPDMTIHHFLETKSNWCRCCCRSMRCCYQC